MLPDEDKTKEQLTSELAELRRRVAELEVTKTKRKQVEEALRESEEKYRYLFENLNDAAFLADVETGYILYTNKQAEVLLGCTRGEIIGMHQSELHPPEKTRKYRQRFATHVEKGHAADYDGEVIRKDGTIVQVNISAVSLTIGEKRLILGLFRDITERKQAEEELNVRAQILDSATDSIFVYDFDGNLIYLNEATCKLNGYTRDELLGMKLHDLVSPEYARLIELRNKQLLEKGEAVFESVRLRKDKSMIPIEVHARTINWGDKQLFLSVARNITERKLAEEREKELQQELYLSSRLASIGELAAGVAHELNNPLTGIMGFSQRLLRKSTDAKVSQDLERIHNEAQRAAKVVHNLLTFARRREPKKECVDANDILQKALELRAYEMKTSNTEVVTDLTPNPSCIMADFYQIQEVFLNIILNAEQVMTEAKGGGKLTIKTQEAKGYIKISFTDDGPGMTAEQLVKVFDPFFTTRDEKGGTGLGLSVCHGIVTEHGGKIYARSKLGTGTTFFVELPLATKKIAKVKL